MANKTGHRRFGTIRKLPSGRYQVRYRGPDGQLRAAPRTFAGRDEAARWLTLTEGQLIQQDWIDPARGKVKLQAYAEKWIAQRPNLRPRTIQLYRWTLQKHITPYIGGIAVGRISPAVVREWRTRLLDDGVSVGGAAKAYRLLRAILMTAVKEDGIIRDNPCRIPGADREDAAERPTISVAQVMKLAESVPARYRALILTATFGCLRWGEVSAIQRADLDPDAGTVRVRQAFTEQRGVGLVLGPPKSKAGRRTVSLPAAILPTIRTHLDSYVPESLDSFVFTTENGRPIWRGNFNKLVAWQATVAAIGAPGLHFHDLRHTGNTMAAQTGTSLRDLMTRMGHDSPRAALIYQHASTSADQVIAAAISAALDLHAAEDVAQGNDDEDGPDKPEDGDDGTAGVPALVS